MKTTLTAAALFFLFCSCSEKTDAGNIPKPLYEQLLGRWKLVSETRSGSYDNSRYKGLATDFIEYRADGKAYSQIQGQYGYSYDPQPDNATNSIRFYFLCTHPYFLSTYPCLTPPDCSKPANIRFISDNLLVIGQTFRDTSNGVVATLNIIDSLVR